MENIKVTSSLEDYLEAIYKIIEEKHGVKAIEISKRLNVQRSSVTEALKNLAEKKLVNYGRYDVISLTEAGKKVAREVIRKHQVLYDFFSQILGVNPEEAQLNACKVEHVISEDAFKRLKAFVDFCKDSYSDKKTISEEFKNFHK